MFIVTLAGLELPLTSPLQLPKKWPAVGEAVSETMEPAPYKPPQLDVGFCDTAPQPAGLIVTVNEKHDTTKFAVTFLSASIVTAVGLASYAFAVPTLSDSGPQGNPVAYFMVKAEVNANPYNAYWFTPVDS
ncbi:MAG: hypothetical protein HY260_01850, partial [Chloroflexi bacterium]|nr:hypothetical protein [Chloroflexota bacterium]